MKFLILAAFVGLAVASDEYNKGKDYKVEKKVEYGYEKKSYDTKGYDNKGYDNKGYEKGYGYENKQVYHGKYGGKCGNDGFYYSNEYSFVICSNGNSYDQKCAPGSKNSGYDNYEYGRNYYYHDFCDVNLVDYGYGVKRGYGNDKLGYGNDHGKRDGYGYREESYGGKESYGKNSYGRRDSYGKDSYGKDSYGKDSYGKDSYGHKESYGYRSDNYGRNDGYGYGERDGYGYGRDAGYRGGYRGDGYGRGNDYGRNRGYNNRGY